MSVSPRRPRAVLVGPPGSGKSTVGVALSRLWGVAFRDTDADVEARTGRSIADIFVVDGEPAFRALEVEAVTLALDEHPGVLALGGGAVMTPAVEALLEGHTVVFLDVGLSEAARRIGLNRDRPLLIGNPRAQWKTLMDVRRPVYTRVASVSVLTDGLTPERIAEEVDAAVAAKESHQP